MNKKLMVCTLFGLSCAGLCAMEAEDSLPTQSEPIEGKSFKRGHRRTHSETAPAVVTQPQANNPNPLTTIALIKKVAATRQVEAVRLRRGLSTEESKEAFDKWTRLHGLVAPARASRYKGGKTAPEELPIPEEFPEQE